MIFAEIAVMIIFLAVGYTKYGIIGLAYGAGAYLVGWLLLSALMRD